MSKIVYTAEPQGFKWSLVLPWQIAMDLYQHRLLIRSMAVRDFRSAYQASYLGLTWQVLLPLIMLAIFYFVIGKVMGGRFISVGDESPLDFALALFVGLGFFNTFAQNLGSASYVITSNTSYVKTLSFPLEVLPFVSAINSMMNLLITIGLTILALLIFNGGVPASSVTVPFYITSLFFLLLGVSYGLSALAVFVRDITPLVSPISLMLMFMCPIFYPMSMVPSKLRWLIEWNPLAIIIEGARAALLQGEWPNPISVLAILIVSMLIAIAGYYFFMRAKGAFSDVM